MRDTDDIAAYDFELPDEQIAVHPVRPRSASRMLVVGPGDEREDTAVRALPSLLRPGDLLVVNDARVTPVRLLGHRETGGAVEVFVVGLGEEGRWGDPAAPMVAWTRSNKRLREGETVTLEGGRPVRVAGRTESGLTHVVALDADVFDLFRDAGSLPLPPYIAKRRREIGEAVEQAVDARDYQTMFADRDGAVAAPTAGLHFDDELVAAVRESGADVATITLRVGAGTFAPVRSDRLSDHELHIEHYEVGQPTAERIAAARAGGGRVVAVGTTVVRTLESAFDGSRVVHGPGSTKLFIRPGFRFEVVDALLTNFHLPRSTLLSLVCAFGGYDRVMWAYGHAVKSGYRFYSYGDAMFLPARSER